MYIKQIGQGPDLVMLHGWSMYSAVWHDLADKLAKNFTLYLVDLPGHGKSSWQQDDLELDVLVNNLAMELPETAYWMGWSLGGLISLSFSEQFPKRVKKLILMATTPCFVQQDDWQCAMDADIFKQFAENLNHNQAETLQRFLLLQARGSEHSRDTIRKLGKQLAIENPPRSEALQAGLKLLIETDMRKPFSDLAFPVQIILGDRDTLIPKEMLQAAMQLYPEVDINLLTGAGHAPFISQPIECQKLIESFINE